MFYAKKLGFSLFIKVTFLAKSENFQLSSISYSQSPQLFPQLSRCVFLSNFRKHRLIVWNSNFWAVILEDSRNTNAKNFVENRFSWLQKIKMQDHFAGPAFCIKGFHPGWIW